MIRIAFKTTTHIIFDNTANNFIIFLVIDNFNSLDNCNHINLADFFIGSFKFAVNLIFIFGWVISIL